MCTSFVTELAQESNIYFTNFRIPDVQCSTSVAPTTKVRVLPSPVPLGASKAFVTSTMSTFNLPTAHRLGNLRDPLVITPSVLQVLYLHLVVLLTLTGLLPRNPRLKRCILQDER
jgi:hypothetical protein